MHVPVMLEETITNLNIKSDGVYIDATLGRAGHSVEIQKYCPDGILIGFDKDLEALEASKKKLSSNTILIHDSFANLKSQLKKHNISNIDGILFDLGVSSPQFDEKGRGFSYRFDAKLDMRMDQTQCLSAYDVVNTYGKDHLISILKTNADERYAKGIVEHIFANRPIETTFELVECIKKAYPKRELRKGHPAKKTFQAIRMEVNNELKDIQKALIDALQVLKVGGRICVITFHSVEDRLVKKIFNDVASFKKVNPRIPMIEEEKLEYRWIQKALKPTQKEIEENNRAHSAILRVLERIEDYG